MRSQTANSILDKIRDKKVPYFVKYFGLTLRIDKDVYPPSEDSLFLAENLRNARFGIKPGDCVLDYGTGSGILALVAANFGGKVVGVDINPLAVHCARYNARINHLGKHVEIRHEGFKALLPEERFDIVVANLPFEDSEPCDFLEYSVYDPDFKMRRDLFDNIRKHLSASGRIFFTYSERVQKIVPLEKFCTGFHLRILDKRLINDKAYFLYLIT